MVRKQVRGPVRDHKAGLRTGDDRTAKLVDKAIRYLESELEMLVASPGCAKEVLAIAKGLEAIRASQSGQSTTPSVRAEFDLGGDG